MDRRELIDIFNDTLNRTVDAYPSSEVKVTFYAGDLAKAETSDKTPITMIHGGTASTGYKFAEDMRVAILNFADAMKYGGWPEEGAATQEENLCRCTNLYRVIGRKECQENYYVPNRDGYQDKVIKSPATAHVYTDRIIYAEGITVFRNDVTYELIAPRKLDVITCPAPASQLSVYDALPIYTQRITQIVLSAIDNNAECIVLGAWGCGAFGQNPVVVAIAFAQVLKKYSGYFKKVVFAMKKTPGWNDMDLYDIFKHVFVHEGVEVIDG